MRIYLIKYIRIMVKNKKEYLKLIYDDPSLYIKVFTKCAIITSLFFATIGVVFCLWSLIHHLFNADSPLLVSEQPSLLQFSFPKLTEYFKNDNVSSRLKSVDEYIQQDLTEDILSKESAKNANPNLTAKFIPKMGGTPIRTIIITTARAGSSFFLQFLGSIPGALNYFEPLIYAYPAGQKKLRINGPPLSINAIDIVKKLLTCRISELPAPFIHGEKVKMLERFLPKFQNSEACPPSERELCKTIHYQTEICRSAPFQVMKLIRLHLKLVEELLADEKLNIRVIYLIRDPRAIVHSRMFVPWCPQHPSCTPENLCAEFESEYEVAKRFNRLYPKKFRIQRYEDWALNLFSESESILHFAGFEFTAKVASFLAEHSHPKGVQTPSNFSVYQNTNQVVYHWRDTFSFERVLMIQKTCRKVMNYWGYREVDTIDDLDNTSNFLTNFTLL